MRELEATQFPKRLKEIPDAPERLWIEGDFPDEDLKFLAVVGSRKCSSYGREAVSRLVSGLKGLPIVIVSGLALGIDALAHESALDAGLRTVAIPGSGLSVRALYPSSNRELARRILESGGCLLSEYEPEFRATAWSFPRRNRIMAGIAHAVLVIEAEEKSGTLITSKLATEYNRDVFAVPGSIFSSLSDGPHMLIRLGATPIRSSKDIAEALGMDIRTGGNKTYEDCGAEELSVIKHLSSPISRDDLLRASDLPPSRISAALSLLEIKGYIKESGGKLYLT